jgi:FAD/FMN-containing dehydrogenase
MHAMLLVNQPPKLTAQDATDADSKIQAYMKKWRELTPGEGSYMNEGDPEEPDWQQSFFGDSYERLLQIKRDTDPWGLFWAQTTVGSEGWAVKVVDGYPGSQNGRLCRVTNSSG